MKTIFLCVGLAVCAPNVFSQVIISEIHFNPCTDQGSDSECEFIELFNAHATVADLSGWRLSGITLDHPGDVFPTGTTLEAGAYMVIGNSLSTCNPLLAQGYDLTVASAEYSGSLLNSGEIISLISDCGDTITSVAYGGGASWASGPDATGNPDGGCESLQLLSMDDNADPATWTDGPNDTPPSPGTGVLSTTTQPFSACVLPLTYLSFEVTQVQNGVELNWMTVLEDQTDFFMVEHSTTGHEFEQLGRLLAAGTSVSERTYQYLHTQPATGANFYRVNGIDLDGSAHPSGIRDVRIASDSEESFILHPMPVDDILNISYPELMPGRIQILDISGKILFERTLSKSINLTHLPAGTYLLKINNAQVNVTRKLIKN